MPNLVSLPSGRAAYAQDRPSTASFVLGFLVLTVLSVGCGAMLASHLVSDTRNQVLQLERDHRQGAASNLNYVLNARIKTLKPLVTNLSAPKNAWVRLQASLVLNEEAKEDFDIVASHIEEDMLAYMRTLTIAQIEGPLGLQHLREDLNERARMRSKGQVREVVLESLVVQ